MDKKIKTTKKLKITKGFSFEILPLDLLYQHIRKFATEFSKLFGRHFQNLQLDLLSFLFRHFQHFVTEFSKLLINISEICHWF